MLTKCFRYGRKIAVVLALFLEAVFVTLSAFVTEFWLFLLIRFLIGTALGGTMLCCFVLLVELSGRTMRPYIMGLCEVPYVSGYVALAIIAYFVREWRLLQLVTGAPWLLTLALYWVLPESPRWLITVGRKKEAIQLLTFIAKK
jgi:MFS family permease